MILMANGNRNEHESIERVGDWMLYETLLHHKNMLHHQIDL